MIPPHSCLFIFSYHTLRLNKSIVIIPYPYKFIFTLGRFNAGRAAFEIPGIQAEQLHLRDKVWYLKKKKEPNWFGRD